MLWLLYVAFIYLQLDDNDAAFTLTLRKPWHSMLVLLLFALICPSASVILFFTSLLPSLWLSTPPVLLLSSLLR